MEIKELPLQEGKSYYEIRLESIGGLGANLCGKMLGELAVKYLGFNSTAFSSYGSEKTGTPVKAHIRYCRGGQDIRTHAPVEQPDLLVLFHQALIQKENVWEGCGEDTRILTAVSEKKLDLKEISKIRGEVFAVDAQRIAMEVHSRMNVVMLGAMVKVMGFVPFSAAEQICRDALGFKYPDTLKENLAGVKRGYEEVKEIKECEEAGEIRGCEETGETKGCEEVREIKGCGAVRKNQRAGTAPVDEGGGSGQGGKAKEREKRKIRRENSQNTWGYAHAPIGGINPRFGSTVVSDLSPSRQGYIPVFIKERCINCGFCDSTCPDMVFQFQEGEYQGKKMMVNCGLDYYHCKGCLRCVDVCPVNALVQGLETDYPDKPYFLPNQEMIRMPDYYVKTGADGYITSESFMTEKRMEGGEV